MKFSHWVAGVTLGFCFILASCGTEEVSQPSASTPAPTVGKQAATPPSPPSDAATTSQAVVVRLDDRELWAPLLGTIKAYVIREASQLAPGLLADGFLGDLVLENDLVRFVVRRPDKNLPSMPPIGAIIDVSNSRSKADYLNYYEAIPDVESTTSKIRYESVASFIVDRQTTARLVLRGHVVETVADAESTTSSERQLAVSAVTTYELPKNEPYLRISTKFTNESSAPVTLAPGDYIDWGEATTFVEGAGVLPTIYEPANWVAAAIDDFSAGVCVPGMQPLLAVTSGRFTVVQAFGNAAALKASTSISVPKPSKLSPTPLGESLKTTPSGVSSPAVQAPSGPGQSLTPTLPVPQPTVAPPASKETRYNQSPVLPLRSPSRSETHYGPSLAPPAKETKYTGVGETLRDNAPNEEDLPGKLSLGGGAESRSDSTKSEKKSDGVLIDDKGRVTLQPGQSVEFVRYLVVSTRDLGRLGRTVYELKGIPTSVIAGAVLEDGSNAPIEDAEIRISGGPKWDGKSNPRAFTRAVTRRDGTFSVRLPYGNYHVTAFKVGRTVKGGSQIVKLFRNSPNQIVALLMSRPATVRVAVSDPDAPTSVGLPCRVTLLAKPGTPPVDWGFSPNIAGGVRNLFYLPFGAAVMPVTPGQYRMIISRGIEYDAVEQDIVVTEGSDQKIVVTLPHAWKMPGTISTDIGVMTTASAVGLITPEDLVIMAACEGVSVLVSGDYDQATDLAPVIQRLKLDSYVRAFPGMRMLVHGRGLTANVLVYPVTQATAEKLRQFQAKHRGAAPDIFLADLRRAFPDLVIQVDQPLHPLGGYLAQFPFDQQFKRFQDDNVPPPDFHALQVLNGKVVGEFQDLQDRYFDLAIKRTRWPEPAPALTAIGGSMCRLPYGTEVGYPRVYVYTTRDTLDRFTPEDLVQAIKGQHVVVTNSLFPKLNGYNPATRTFGAQPGDVIETGTTGSLPLKINIYAASWVSLSNFDLTWNGKAVRRIQVMPVQRVLRYPVRAQKDADQQIVYVTSDGFTNLVAYSARKTLSPIVPPAPQDWGGEVWPLSWTGPIFIDQDRNGKVVIPAENSGEKTTSP